MRNEIRQSLTLPQPVMRCLGRDHTGYAPVSDKEPDISRNNAAPPQYAIADVFVKQATSVAGQATKVMGG